ncbi:hypothetical protein GCM10020331_053850 [Ectobacillus funiculus]
MHDDPNIIRVISRKLKRKKELAIFISLNGETEELVEAAKKNLKKLKVLVLLPLRQE